MKALILARGGSKGVPGKNIRLLNHFPLIAYPILAAQKTKEITEVFVSTDSETIAQIAASYDAEIIERPSELAQDTSRDIDSFIHAVKTKHWGLLEPIVHLRATTPLVKPYILDSAIRNFTKNINNCTSLRSAHKVEESVFKFFKKEGDFWASVVPGTTEEQANSPRQAFPENYIPNGYIDIVKPTVFFLGKTFHGNKILSYVTSPITEVDSEEDLKRLEYEVQFYAI